jgi:hypothetical protein
VLVLLITEVEGTTAYLSRVMLVGAEVVAHKVKYVPLNITLPDPQVKALSEGRLDTPV